jgi:uncharacterized DUF497 family protein/predicted DNA binding CopG/RHH family protein
VESREAEDVFSSARLRLLADTEHSVAERRCAAHGTSAAGRQLAVFFTIRGSHIRIISARDMSRKERRDYGKIKRPSNTKPKIALTSIPRFENEDEERTFWATAETGDYFDMTKAQWVVFPKLQAAPAAAEKQNATSISLRLPNALLADLRAQADERDVPYQSLLKVYLADRVREERRKSQEAGPRMMRGPAVLCTTRATHATHATRATRATPLVFSCRSWRSPS